VSDTTPLIRPAPGWDELAAGLADGTVLAVGSPGLGKSRLLRYLSERLAAAGRRVGLLSADMGQASVGVPCCLGLSLGPAWDDPTALWFIGDTSPVGHLLPAVVGTARLARRARALGVQTLLVDPTGLVAGPVGRVLKYHKALAVGADRVIALQRAAELEPLLALLEGPCPVSHRLSPVPEAHDRSPAERKSYREARFRAHLHAGCLLPFDPGRLLGPDWAPGWGPVAATALPDTVVGLLDAEGFCLALGVLEEAGPDRLGVYTAWRRPDAVARVQIGRLRLTRLGEEKS
jgi:polynucleotide 5'-hydroxyl-kinase GRC3/NOL9